MLKKTKRLIDRMGEQLFWVGATVFSAGVHFVFSIYIKAHILPLEYGMYSTCMLLQTYLSYLQLGSLSAFNRDYPQLVGAKKTTEAKKYRNTVFTFVVLIYFVAFILVCLWFSISKNNNEIDNKLVIGFVLAALLSGLTIIENFGNYRCRIEKGFRYPSFVILLELFSVLIGIILVPQIGYYSIYLTSIIGMIIGIVLYSRSSYKDIRLSFDFELLKAILASGAPLLISGLIWTVVNSIDKFMILSFINTEALGVYGIAQNAFSYMVLIPTAMSQMFYVKMGTSYGETGDRHILVDVSNKYASILATLTSVIAVIAYYLLPVMVQKLMVSYTDGVRAAQILILGLSVYAATLINGNLLTILKKNRALLVNSCCMCVFNLICSLFFIKMLGATIESVALGTSISYVFYTMIIIYQVSKHASCSAFKLLKASVMPVVITLIPSAIIYNVISNKIIGLLLSLFIIVVVYCFVCRKRISNIIKGEIK